MNSAFDFINEYLVKSFDEKIEKAKYEQTVRDPDARKKIRSDRAKTFTNNKIDNDTFLNETNAGERDLKNKEGYGTMRSNQGASNRSRIKRHAGERKVESNKVLPLPKSMSGDEEENKKDKECGCEAKKSVASAFDFMLEHLTKSYDDKVRTDNELAYEEGNDNPEQKSIKKNKIKKAYDPAAVAAAIGRKKYGNKKFAQMAARGKKRSEEGKKKTGKLGGGKRFKKLEQKIEKED